MPITEKIFSPAALLLNIHNQPELELCALYAITMTERNLPFSSTGRASSLPLFEFFRAKGTLGSTWLHPDFQIAISWVIAYIHVKYQGKSFWQVGSLRIRRKRQELYFILSKLWHNYNYCTVYIKYSSHTYFKPGIVKKPLSIIFLEIIGKWLPLFIASCPLLDCQKLA